MSETFNTDMRFIESITFMYRLNDEHRIPIKIRKNSRNLSSYIDEADEIVKVLNKYVKDLSIITRAEWYTDGICHGLILYISDTRIKMNILKNIGSDLGMSVTEISAKPDGEDVILIIHFYCTNP